MEVKPVPKDTLTIIPKYDGEENVLNLFLSKCEYVVNGSRIRGNLQQELYLFHVISSRLTGRAAALLSDNPNVTSYEDLKLLLTQHFGDPRSEECIAIELENLKLKTGESYIQFCHRIQGVRSSLLAKVNRLPDEGLKAAKMIVYNNIALNVFLYNLPEDLIRIVRLKGCSNLESALSIVTEEVNFKFQYEAKNKLLKHTTGHSPLYNVRDTPKPLNIDQNLKPIFNSMPNSNFRFGIPQNNFRFGMPQNNFHSAVPKNNFGFKPSFGQQNSFIPPPQGYRFGMSQNQPSRNFGQGPAQRMPFQQNSFKFGIPHQPNYKFGIPNQSQYNLNQNKFGSPAQGPRLQNTDVSMRTAPIRQNMITNELFYMEQPPSYNEYYPEYIDEYNYDYYGEDSLADLDYSAYSDDAQAENINTETAQPENFQETASKDTVK